MASTAARRSPRKGKGRRRTHQACLLQRRARKDPSASLTSRLDMDGTLGNGQGRLLHCFAQRWMGVASASEVFG